MIRARRDVQLRPYLVAALERYPLAIIPFIRTADEGRRKFIRFLVTAILVVLMGLLILVAAHFYYMPLDLLILKVLARLGM